MFRRAFFIVFLAACGGSAATPPTDGGVSVDAGDEPHRCDLAACADGFARTCDNDPIALDCTAFGGTCSGFTDPDSGSPFQWCSCGSLGNGDGYCTGGRFGVACVDGLAAFGDCGVGFTCSDIPSGPYAISCSCNNIPDGICPDPTCTSDPDCDTCTPSCTGRACGDNGCGGQCGTCAFGQSCTAAGQCEQICVPNCTGKQCGDDGCDAADPAMLHDPRIPPQLHAFLRSGAEVDGQQRRSSSLQALRSAALGSSASDGRLPANALREVSIVKLRRLP
jgi:hypothetical protein